MNKKMISAIVLVMCIVVTIISTGVKNTVINCDDNEYSISGDLGELADGTVVEYNFKSNGETIQGLEFIFATYGEQLEDGVVRVEVYEKDSTKLLGEGKIKASAIEDNKLTMVKTGRINLGKRDIRVVIYCEGFDEDRLLTMWMGDNEENEDSYTRVNGMHMKSSILVFKQIVTQEAPYTWDCILITSISFVVFCCMPGSLFDKSNGKSEEDNEPDEENTEA